MSRTIQVRTPTSTYPIRLGRGLLDEVGEIARSLGLGSQVVIATDARVAPLHAGRVTARLAGAGFTPHVVVMEAGEVHKGWASLDLLISGCAEAGLDRSGWLLALGGGVVGDTAGLAAALYMRGVPLVQAPTTLLAMTDASVGGKVAIDHRLGKNLIGVFKQPVAVVVDLATLATLPDDEVANGMAEVVKAAILGGSGLLDLLNARAPVSEEMVAEAIDVKKRIVEADPYERNQRALLNLGHTFGHAFERLSGYGLKHGFGVAQGMMAAAHLAERLSLAPPALTAQTAGLLGAYRLPLHWGEALPPGTTPADVLGAMSTDKKREAGRLRFVLARSIGDVRLETGVPEDAVLAALAETYTPPAGPSWEA